MRTFDSGATRDSDDEKLDYEGFINPIVQRRYAEYMHQHRKQADGSLRDSDNWQKGIPISAYRKSLIRHVMTLWGRWRGAKAEQENVGGVPTLVSELDLLCAIRFNVDGLMLELLNNQPPLDLANCPNDTQKNCGLPQFENYPGSGAIYRGL